MAYVTAEPPGGCLLCAKLTNGDDRKNLILCRRPNAFVILNAYPYSSGHLMVAPNRHVADLERLSSEEATETMTLAQAAVRALTAVYHPDGFNLGMNLGSAAGAGVPEHLHLHVVPRWSGDTSFMPIVGQVKVIPETLENTFEKLLPHFTS
jgi:ATP adenylyltransferase